MLQQNVVAGIVITAVASLFFATGATLQHYAIGNLVDHSSDNKSMGIRQLIRMIKTPLWLLGLTVITAGAAGHIWGLTHAPVTVVQPVGILAVPWSVMMAAKLHGHKITKRMWQAVGVTFGGIIIFTAFSATHASSHKSVEPHVVLMGAIIVYCVGFFFGFLGWRGKSAIWRSLFWATGGSFFYGLSSALIKSFNVMMHDPSFMWSTMFWVLVPFLVGSYAFGAIMIMQGYACGPAEVVVGSMDTTDPIVAVGFGLILLGEGARIGPPAAAGMVVGAIIAIGGVIMLSRNHPNATNSHAPGKTGVDDAAVDGDDTSAGEVPAVAAKE